MVGDNKSMDKESEGKALIGRFIELRKKYGPTQGKFGEKLGISDVSVSKIESGKITLNDKHVKLICGTLGVNEAWLREGTGPMFSEEIPGQKQLLEAFRQLSPDGRKAAIKLIEALLDSELERTFDEGYKAGMRGLAKETAPKQALGDTTKPLEASQEAKPTLDTEKGESPSIGPSLEKDEDTGS
jgi:transcriptional regulator with XRE-family HTH domain